MNSSNPSSTPLIHGDHALPSTARGGVGASVAMQGLSAEVAGGRQVLKDIDALVPGASLCAIMGSSGSGKTTLVKAIASVPSDVQMSGQVALGQVADSRSVRVAYLPQFEAFLPSLTVRETLGYAAALQATSGVTAVDELLTDLALQSCAETRIGTISGSGISGGERRRLSLAVRLLHDVRILCADEPTSGLDSRSAGLVASILRRQADGGCTVLCSIHQPRQGIFDMFDHILLLSDGHLVYGGPAAEAVRHVQDCTGIVCPDSANVADFLVDTSALDRTSSDRMAASVQRIESLSQAQRSRLQDLAAALNDAVARGTSLLGPGGQHAKHRKASYHGGRVLSEANILLRRALVCARRDALLALAVVMQNFMFGFVFGAMNWQLSTASLPEIHSRLALIYITPALSGFFVMSANLYIFEEQLEVFDNERHRDGLYSAVALVLSQFGAALPLNLLGPLPMFLLVYFMAGLQVEAAVAPVVFFLVLVLVRLHSTALAILFAVVVPRRSFEVSAVVANTYFLLCIFTGGFLTPIASLPPYLEWCRWFAYTFYAFRWNASAQFSDLTLDLDGLNLPGSIILDTLGFTSHDFVVPPLCILALTAGWLSLATLALFFIAPAVGKVDGRGDTRAPTELGAQTPSGARRLDGATVLFDHVSLELVRHGSCMTQRSSRHVTLPAKKLLQDVSIGFGAGNLVAIAGPSGAGKTSLLSILAGRVGGTVAKLSGQVVLDGLPVSQAKLRQQVALVGQEDQHLPGLTVQETLNYFARLRLPSLSEEGRQSRVQSMVKELGLAACLNIRVGVPTKGGISGGERRRLSVLMACLGDPSILLLDEPTTGLDSLAAYQLVNMLQRLATQRGQTVVCTVHQPRADLLSLFHRIILLGLGGHLLWEGSSEELSCSVGACGVHIPHGGNPMDLAMDILADTEAAAVLHERWALTSKERFDEVAALAAESPRVPAQLHGCPPCTAFRILLARSLRNFARQPAMIWARCAQVVVFAIVLVPTYAPLGHSQASITSRIGLLYQSLGMLFAGTLNNLAVFPTERDVLLREGADGLYSVLPFFAMYSVVEMALGFLTSLLAGVIIVQATGLRGDFTPQATFVAVLFASLANGESIGIILNSVVLHAGFSVNMINGCCAILQIMAGFMANSLPKPLAVLNRISPQMYACRALAVSQFPADETFHCDGPSPICQRTGKEVLESLGLDQAGTVGANLAALAACCVAYRVLSFFILSHRLSRTSRL